MRIYSAPVLAQVMHIKHVLEMHDIAYHIQGEYRSGAAGELVSAGVVFLARCPRSFMGRVY